MSNTFAHAGDLGDVIYSLPTIRALGGGHLRFWKRNYVRDPMSIAKVASIMTFFASQPYIESVGYDETVVPTINLDDFRAAWMQLRKQGTHLRYNLAELFLFTFNLPLGLACTKWLDIKPDAYRFQPSVIFSRSFRYRNNKFPWKKVHDKYKDEACFLGTRDEHHEFESTIGSVLYRATPLLLEAAQLISTAKLVVANQNALAAVAIGLKKPTLMECWVVEPNCLFDCVIPGFDSGVKLPDL